MECIKYWGNVYENEREPLQRFPNLYKKLLSKGAKFPQSYYFIQNKDQKGADQLKPRLSPANSSKDVKNTDKKRKEGTVYNKSNLPFFRRNPNTRTSRCT